MDSSSAPQRVLVVLLGAIGDVVRGLAVLGPIKQAFPSVKIDWLVEPLSAPLVTNCRYVDKVIVFKRRTKGAVFAALKELRQNSYDLVLDMQRHLKSGLFSWFARGKRSIGVHRRDAKEFNWFFHREHLDYYGEDNAKQYQYMEFLNYLKIPWSRELDFGFSPDIARGTELLGVKGGVGVVLGSSWLSKDWVPAGYSELVERLISKNKRVVLLGDSKAAALGEKLGGISPLVLNLCGKTKVVDLVHVIALLDSCVGPDSGPGHIAAALGVPYVGLFGPTSAKRVGFYQNAERSISFPIGCSECYRKICPGLDRLCMRLISPKLVEERVLEAIADRR